MTETAMERLKPETIIDLQSATIEELSNQAVDSHKAVLAVGVEIEAVLSGLISTALFHAMNAGDALAELSRRLSRPEWERWIAANMDCNMRKASMYIRYAHYRHEIMKSERPLDMSTVQSYLVGLPMVGDKGHSFSNRVPDEVRKEAVRLRKAGHTIAEIHRRLELAKGTVQYFTDPNAAKKKRARRAREAVRQRAAKAALRQAEREKAVRSAGGSASHAYEHLRRRLLPALDAALSAASSREQRDALREAMGYAHKVEDAIVKASRAQGHQ